ncbi:MAG TPA: nucleotidyltransferase family protein [Pusillimonas sp.]|uniref:nucleotidyltransferase family protein n=1 Tax=Pusillimonas sp. TaxID=3040095 RepID=UPI002CC99298|nr:nucleotidyltransferase family protein [Pusillimonas sp.]HUH87114.1 nucleotidyltransferase family protein [Pusillimonas sp.]
MSESTFQFKAQRPETGGPPVLVAVLAAGLSRRMGPKNKLLQEIDGAPMVRKVVEQALASLCERVVVVVGHEAQKVREALSGLSVQFVDNLEFQEGLAASVRAAASATQPHEALLVCLGDMPRVSATELNQLIHAYWQQPGKAAYQPGFKGKRGNPVLWAPAMVQGLGALQGDEGARSLLNAHRDNVLEVPVHSDAIFMDIDTPQALRAARGQEKFLRP